MTSIASSPIPERLKLLREKMESKGLSAWIVPSSDPHSSEYVADHWQGRKWISGFTGSAGTAVVLADTAGVWTDGRYFIQAADELNETGFDLHKQGIPDAISYEDWIVENLVEGSKVGFDGKVLSYRFFVEFKRKCDKKNIEIITHLDLLDDIWTDRPSLPESTVVDYPLAYAGKSRDEKLIEVRNEMKKLKVNHFMLTTLDDIAWLFNIRAADIPYCPVKLAHSIISENEVSLFIDTTKLPQSLLDVLNASGVRCLGYEKVEVGIKSIPAKDSVLVDPNIVNSHFVSLLHKKIILKKSKSITTVLKAIKNPVEQEHLKECHRKDGAAMVKFFKALDEKVPKGEVTELSAAEIVKNYRKEIDTFVDLSFTTIPGYGGNGAMMHYSSTEESSCVIGTDNFFLVDSGGQYLDGTTDITRTLNFGELNTEQREDYTLVLKGHINLAKARFMAGTRGVQLDMLARQPLWDRGINYSCGTGHGIGHFLNVHEGPQSISPRFIDEEFKLGMNVTNEPGIYRKDKWGIRIENIYLIVPSVENEFGTFYEFETVTMCPINTKPIVVDMMSAEEKLWLNEYHSKVYHDLSPYLNEEEKVWLKNNTREI